MSMVQRFECNGLQELGLMREVNTDQFFIGDLLRSVLVRDTGLTRQEQVQFVAENQSHLAMVVDSLNENATATEIAVQATVDYLLEHWPWAFKTDLVSHEDFFRELAHAVEHCHDELVKRARRENSEPLRVAMTLACINMPQMYLAHVGNTRCYLWHDSRLEQLTTDHTGEQQLSQAGMITREEEAAFQISRLSGHVWNRIGDPNRPPAPDLSLHTLVASDKLLLCSDGLTTHVSDEQIAGELSADYSTDTTARRLMHLALENGGTDNITVIVARFVNYFSRSRAKPAVFSAGDFT